MAKEKIECPLCDGGTLVKTAPKKGHGLVRLVCDRKGNDPNCKGWAYGGHQKKEAGAPQGGLPVRELQHAAKEGEGATPEPDRPKDRRGFLDIPIFKY